MERSDGVKVGWWDLVGDELHPESPERLDELTRAVAGWKATHLTAAAVRAPARGAARI